ncbi:hypothetical protein SAMN05216559_0959 [Halomicrobium zhouii]|uniref:Uncharacterized protein n=1 Tax=Halomicrobium zhouii TaxID=767519 RepID=A0A1I6KL01_9EURY|nr:hypothetical protein [Halomicrobium zhouii]SFR91718.1 hypothetical protein SAMN05216559_0959 [Halomicrobium zhouii]
MSDAVLESTSDRPADDPAAGDHETADPTATDAPTSEDDWSFDQSPSTLGVATTIVAGLVAVAATTVSPPAALLALAGLLVLAVGVHRGSNQAHKLGTAGLFAGVLLAGAAGASPAASLVAFGGAVLAWDAGENAISLGRQLGAHAPTRRATVVHVAATGAVASVVGVLALVVYDLSRAGQPTTAVALLLVAALLFIWLLDD